MDGGRETAIATSGPGTVPGWGNQDTPMLSSTDDDFQQFLDMGGMANLPDPLQFDFGTDFQPADGGDTPMTGTGITPIQATTAPVVSMATAVSMSALPAQIVSPAGNDPIMNIDAQIQMLQNQKMQFQQQQQQQQQQQRRMEEQQAIFFAQQNRMVPPTPRSSEMHQHSMYDQFHRLREQQDMSFTPLVSPAVTPLETQFSAENQFAVNPAYFSPLSSPALHAQNDSMSYERLAGLSVNSPVDMGKDPPSLGSATGSVQAANSSVDLNKKLRKANAASKTRSKASVRQSPITKPQKKRTASTPNISKRVINELVEHASQHTSLSSCLLPPAAQSSAQSAVNTDTSEEDGSVSPETITEMPPPPPPQPRSARQSPYIQSQKKAPAAKTNAVSQVSPATPASLLKLPSPSIEDTTVIANGSDVIVPDGIDNLELPEPVTSKPGPELNTKQRGAQYSPDQTTPKGTAPPPLPSPVFAKPTGTISASQSPQIAPGLSGQGPNRKTPQLGPRSSKKRSSASVQSSPALRPRISPSIKPLLPSGSGMSVEDTASQLLATKSNYQNILEGNKVPGVTYPSELSTNLTSKRTSHKIAEQGRRNRINTALQEIASLLPREEKSDSGENGDKKDGKQATGPNSKASTVEMAIQYIKELQKRVESERERADAAEKKLEELKEV